MLEVGSGSHAAADRARHGAPRAGAARASAGRGARPGRRQLDARRGARRRRSCGIPVAHVEAGLRSASTARCPRRSTAIVTDQLSDLLFIHSPEARDNLLREGRARRGDPRRRQHDDRHARRDARRGSTAIGAAGARTASTPGGYLVVTLHRPALVDGPLLADALGALDGGRGGAAGGVPGASAHARGDGGARPRRRRPACGSSSRSATWSSSALVADAAGVLTDSGGIQEETTFLGVPCFTLRDNTERPVTVELGTNVLLGLAPERIARGAGADPPDARARRVGPARLGRLRRRAHRRGPRQPARRLAPGAGPLAPRWVAGRPTGSC